MIAERALKFLRADGVEQEVFVGIEDSDQVMEISGKREPLVAVIIHTGSRGDRGNPIFGVDKLQALGSALAAIEVYLQKLQENGRLAWPDGRDHVPTEAPLFAQESLRRVSAKAS